MVTRADTETWEEKEARLLKMSEDAGAGYCDGVLEGHLAHLFSQLPAGYTLDDESRIVRLDPDLPDHVYIDAEVFGVPAGRVRVPVYTGKPALPSLDGEARLTGQPVDAQQS